MKIPVFRVIFPDGPYDVDLQEAFGRTFSLIDQIGLQHEMTLWSEDEGRVRVCGGTNEMMIQVLSELEYRTRISTTRQGTHSGWDLKASLPGKIKAILCSAGDSVGAGDPVLIMEAMKMENEIRAERPGLISEIHCAEGDTVETGTLLIRAAPPDSNS